jgi:hypothetical protein
MPTLEERLEVLEGALSLLRIERVPNVKQLEEQLNERINALQQEIAEQKRRLSEQGQRFTSLEKALSQQFSILNQTLAQNFITINAQFDNQTRVTQRQFEDTNMALTALTVTVRLQGQDIRTLKEEVQGIPDLFEALEQNMNGRFEAQDRRFEAQDKHFETLERNVNSRFETQDKKLDQVLQMLVTLTSKADS